MDAITLLKNDHRTVKRLFRDLDGATRSVDKRRIADQVIADLTTHAYIEEEIFYPFARETVPATDDQVLEAVEEHHLVKVLCAELASLDVSDETFDAKTTVLAELVLHHADEEEKELFPTVRDAVGRKRLAEVGDELDAARRRAPVA